MSADAGSAVQISTYPMDARHAEHLVPHWIRTWRGMVDRIVITIDTHRSRSGRYRGSNFDASLAALRNHIERAREHYPQLEVHDVDYSPDVRRQVAQRFFALDDIPVKAWDGGPFYSYFYGMFMARARYIVHYDGDMLFGGGSTQWMREAIDLFDARPDLLLVSPFPGPPRPDGAIFGHEVMQNGEPPKRENLPALAYRFDHASTRIFLIDMQRFDRSVGALPLLRPSPLQRLKAFILKNPPQAREGEYILSRTLTKFGLCRIDFLGVAPGLWSLHPPYRTEEFYRRLPEIIRRVESGALPVEQLGHFDLHDSVVDWTEARAAASRGRRYMRLLRDRFAGPP